MKPSYDIEKIKFSTDRRTLERAFELYQSGRVTQFQDTGEGFAAVVLGTKPYDVYVSAHYFDRATCTCYLGQDDTLCKHVVATAIQAVKSGKQLSKRERQIIDEPICSGIQGTLEKKKLAEVKGVISAAMRYIKPYSGPSRTWFSYQNSLSEGCNRLAALISELPVSMQTTELIVDVLLRLDKKISQGGVDDSDGTVGGFIEATVEMLEKFVQIDTSCTQAFRHFSGIETCFGWEEPLLKFIENEKRYLR